MRALTRTLVGAALLAVVAAPSQAVTFGVSGVASSNSTADVDFAYDGVNKITVSITNTASVSPDPRITGFAFNIPSAVTGLSLFSASGTANNAGWFGIFNPNDINTPTPLGDYDLGASTGNPNAGNFPNPPIATSGDINGGFPNAGIEQGETGVFMFTLTGTDLDLLTAASFLDLGPDGGSTDNFFAVRFQRLDDNGVTSDVGVPTTDTAVPLPAALPLMGGAIAVFGGLAFRRRQRADA